MTQVISPGDCDDGEAAGGNVDSCVIDDCPVMGVDGNILRTGVYASSVKLLPAPPFGVGGFSWHAMGRLACRIRGVQEIKCWLANVYEQLVAVSAVSLDSSF